MMLKPAAFALTLIAGLGGNCLAHAEAAAPATMRIHPGITKAISPHVHVIPSEGRRGVPNVGIVAGSRAVLVIDSGLGAESGKMILEEVRRIAGERPIYLIATHFHPEHIGGEQGFPPSATVLRPLAQQREIAASGDQLIAAFRKMSADNALLLGGFAFRPADLLFDGTLTLDLGGVSVEIMPAGPAHTDGDMAMLVREDGVLFTGDVVQQNYAPVLMGAHSSAASWLMQISRLEGLPAQIIVPSHSSVTDRRAFGDMRDMLIFARDRWAEIERSGLPAAAAADRMVADFQKRFPACANADLLRMSIAKLGASLEPVPAR